MLEGDNAMVSHHFFSQLVLLALLWLFVILHLFRPKRPVPTPAEPALPALLTPKRPRSNEPKPFEGLTHKPHYALCEQDTASPKAPPPVPPDPMAPPHWRPRAVDTSRHFCPHSDCDSRGWLGLGNLRANGHPSGGAWRQFHCTSCQGYFLETHGTLFHGKQAAVELIVRALYWMQPERRQDKGPRPKPRWMPLPGLLYAQVVKSYRRRRIVGVKHQVVFGTRLAIEEVLARCGWTINTAFVERLNLDIRQRVAAIGRRVNTLCQGEAGLRDQLALFHVYHNFVLAHARLRQPLLVPEVTNGRGAAKVWRPCTPAMAAGVTDHIWSLTEVLFYRGPPWPQAQTV